MITIVASHHRQAEIAAQAKGLVRSEWRFATGVQDVLVLRDCKVIQCDPPLEGWSWAIWEELCRRKRSHNIEVETVYT